MASLNELNESQGKRGSVRIWYLWLIPILCLVPIVIMQEIRLGRLLSEESRLQRQSQALRNEAGEFDVPNRSVAYVRVDKASSSTVASFGVYLPPTFANFRLHYELASVAANQGVSSSSGDSMASAGYHRVKVEIEPAIGDDICKATMGFGTQRIRMWARTFSREELEKLEWQIV